MSRSPQLRPSLLTLRSVWYGLLPPVARRMVVRVFYDEFTRRANARLGAGGITVMNYGFADVPGDRSRPALAIPAKLEAERYGLQLYDVATQGVSLADCDLLEVGCGRGGGAAFLRAHYGPRSVTGLDLSADAIAFCRTRHAEPGLRFEVGDAETLPFEPESFDVVVNIESSHNYHDCAAFYRGVHRVLRPGGTFVYADFFRRPTVPLLRGQLEEAGLAVEVQTTVTPNIVAACQRDHSRRTQLIRRAVPFGLRRLMRTFSATRESAMLRAMESGALEYVVLQARRRTDD